MGEALSQAAAEIGIITRETLAAFWNLLHFRGGSALSGPIGIVKQGAAQVKEKLPESVAIFILPPSREELERRLRSRGQDSEEEIARRLARARDEIQAFGKYYDYCVVNDDMERAGRAVQAILLALRCASARNRGFVERLLASFGGKT